MLGRRNAAALHVERVSGGGEYEFVLILQTPPASRCKFDQRHGTSGHAPQLGSRAETRTRQRYALKRTCYALRRTCSERNSAPAHSPSEGDTRDHTRTVLLQLRLAVRALLQRREGIVRMRTHLIGIRITYLYSVYEKSAGR